MLVQWDKRLPSDFYDTVTHLWIAFPDGRVEAEIKEKHAIHADVWGNEAWEIQTRGYYCEQLGLIVSHLPVGDTIKRKLAKLFDSAMYYYE